MGISLGQASIELDNRPHSDSNLDVEGLEYDGSDTGWKIFGGYKFTVAAAEIAYVDFGRIEGEAESREDFVEVSGVSAFGMLHLGLGPVGVFGKVGGFMWDSEFDSAARDYIDTQEDFDKDGYDLAYGFGVTGGLLGIDARAEYEYFNVGEFDDISMLTVGVSYSF